MGATPALTMLQTQVEISRFLTKGAKQLVGLAVLFNGWWWCCHFYLKKREGVCTNKTNGLFVSFVVNLRV
jgi:hypothetical protein